MNKKMDEYTGAKFLKPVSDHMGVSVDRIDEESQERFRFLLWKVNAWKAALSYLGIAVCNLNFLVCQITALCLAFLMRKYLHPSKTSASIRHAFCGVMGLTLSYICFGNDIIHLLFVSSTSFLIMKVTSPKVMQSSVFLICMGYLAVIHIQKLIHNTAIYSLDITGPLMVMVQRITGLAFSLYDGLGCDMDCLSTYRKKYLTKKQPSFIEFHGYLFQFQSILTGPNILFQDYMHFIDGTNFRHPKIKDIASEPSALQIVLKKVTISVLCLIFYLFTSARYSISTAKGHEFMYEWNVFHQFCYLLTVTSLTRFMYYYAWILAEAICNASGLGFNGFDENGIAKWDLVSNVDIFGFEFSDNIRNAINSWNTGTNIWLRFLVYERMEKYEKYKTLCTFLLSAVWHGFYPGYYLCFTTAAMFVSAARTARKLIRPYFLVNKYLKMFYDFLTIVLARVSIVYFSYPFIMLDFWPSLIIYRRIWFSTHVAALLMIFVLPSVHKHLPEPAAPVVN